MTGSGTLADPYIISDVDDLQDVELDLTAYYELGGDIDASATSGWNAGAGFAPITLFSGQLDGKSFTIDGLFINRPSDYVGLFEYIDTTGVVQNLRLTSADITGRWTGGLVSYNYGTITSCSVSGTITGRGAGGLVETNMGSGTITKSYSTGSVIASGTTTYVGGFIEDNFGSIQDCYSRCSVTGAGATSYVGGFSCQQHTGGVEDNCYSTGAVSGGTTEGGFNSKLNDGTISNCFWDTETSGQASSLGGTGKTTAEMKTQSTFTDAGWDFSTPIWYISPPINNGYPHLGILVAAPTVTTNPATEVEQTTATLNGTLDSDGEEACDVRFQYGETTAYGETTDWQTGRTTDDTFSQEVRGLNSGTVYHFRAVATNSEGTSYGADRTFHTAALSAEAHQALRRGYSLGRHEL